MSCFMSAPTANDFKANAVSGNLGFGTLDVTKNVSNTFDVNNVPLEELESYDLYLWLTDVDGGQSSAVKKVSFTTVDGTPPRFNTNPTVNKVNATSVGLYANLNEAGTLYWVVVKEGEEYPQAPGRTVRKGGFEQRQRQTPGVGRYERTQEREGYHDRGEGCLLHRQRPGERNCL